MIPPSGAQIIEYWARPIARLGGSVTSAAASAAPASGPSTYSSPMCDRSNRPTRSRTVRCSSMIELYWTGMSQPPNSISRAPSSRCASVSGRDVDRRLERVGHGAASAERRRRGRPTGRRPVRRARRPSARRARARSRRSASSRRVVEPDPADLLELVVVPGQVAADRLHQEVVDGLVDARAGLDEPVLDRVERPGDPDLEPGLLARPRGGPSPRVVSPAFGRALGQRPGPAVALATAAADDEPRLRPDS